MKRIVLLIAALCLIFLLTACGSDSVVGIWVPSENTSPSAEGLIALELIDNEDSLDVFCAVFGDGTEVRGIWREAKGTTILSFGGAGYGEASAFPECDCTAELKKNTLTLAFPDGETRFVRAEKTESPVGVWQVDEHLNFDTYEINPDILEYMVIKEDGTLELYFTASYDAPAVLEATWSQDEVGGLSLQFGGEHGEPGATFFKGPYMFYGFFEDSPADIRFVKIDGLPGKDAPDEDDILDPYTVGSGNSNAQDAYIFAPTADRVEADALSLLASVDVTTDSAWYPGLDLSVVRVSYSHLSNHDNDFVRENSPELYKATCMQVSIWPSDYAGRSTFPVWSVYIWYQLQDGHWVISTHTASANLSTAYTY